MSFLEYNVKYTPTGLSKVFYFNWVLALLLAAAASIGFLMLYSVAGGSFSPWAEPQMKRYVLGLIAMFVVAMVPIWLWRNLSVVAYLGSILLLVGVEFFGAVGMGAQRWISLGGFNFQPSEFMKMMLVLLLSSAWAACSACLRLTDETMHFHP